MNEKVLSQMNDLESYKEVSSMPPVIRDISVVVDKKRYISFRRYGKRIKCRYSYY